MIVDFGLARREDVADKLTKSGQIVGTPHYMAPEQIRGNPEEAGASCDIFAMGVILYELLTGRLPFDAPTSLAIVAQILTQKPLPPSAHRPDLDPRLEAICLKAMAKERQERYASMGEMAAALTEYLRTPATASESAGSEEPDSASPHPQVAQSARPGSDTLMGQLLDPVAGRLPAAPDSTASDHHSAALPQLGSKVLQESRSGVDSSAISVARWDQRSRVAPTRRSRWFWPRVAVATSLIGLGLMWATNLFTVKTPDRAIVSKSPPSAPARPHRHWLSWGRLRSLPTRST